MPTILQSPRHLQQANTRRVCVDISRLQVCAFLGLNCLCYGTEFWQLNSHPTPPSLRRVVRSQLGYRSTHRHVRSRACRSTQMKSQVMFA
jgi:hypothetical protein